MHNTSQQHDPGESSNSSSASICCCHFDVHFSRVHPMFTALRSASSRLDFESGRRSEVPSCVKRMTLLMHEKPARVRANPHLLSSLQYSMTFAREWTASAAPRTQGELEIFPSFFRAPATTRLWPWVARRNAVEEWHANHAHVKAARQSTQFAWRHACFSPTCAAYQTLNKKKMIRN